MNSGLHAFAIDYVRRVCLGLSFTVFVVIAGPITFAWYLRLSVPSYPGPQSSDASWEFETVQPVMVLILMVLFSSSMVAPLLRSRHRLFVLPVSNTMIGIWHIAIYSGFVLFCYALTVLAYESYFHMGWSHAPPMLMILGMSSLLMAAVWRLAPVLDAEKSSQDLLGLSYVEIVLFLLKQGAILCPVIGVIAFWYWWHVDANAQHGWQFLPVLDIGLTILTVGVSGVLLVREVGIQRRGESQSFVSLAERADASGEPRKVSLHTWSSTRSATQWMLWHSSRPYALAAAVVFTLLLLVPGIAGLFYGERITPLLLVFLYAAPVTAILLGLTLEHQLDPTRGMGLRTFFATHRMSDAELGRIVFRNALYVYTYYWLLLLIGPAILLLLAFLRVGGANVVEPQFARLLGFLWQEPLVPLQCCFASWSIGWSIVGAMVGLGRRVLGAIVLAAFLVGSVPGVIHALHPSMHYVLFEYVEYIDRVVAFLIFALPVGWTLASYVQANHRRLLSSQQILRYLMCWVVCAAVIFFSMLLVEPQSFRNESLGSILLFLVVIFSLTSAIFLPRAAIPVMITKRRRS